MRIVLGTGKRRKIYDLAHGSTVKRAPAEAQKAYVENVQQLLGVV